MRYHRNGKSRGRIRYTWRLRPVLCQKYDAFENGGKKYEPRDKSLIPSIRLRARLYNAQKASAFPSVRNVRKNGWGDRFPHRIREAQP